MMPPIAERLAADARRELLEDILPFWRRRTVDERRGGFIGRMSNDLRIDEDAPKGLILNARILWTFSAVRGVTGDPEDAALALRVRDYLLTRFRDPTHGGYFWELDPEGRMTDGTKKTYGQAFCAYALAEHHRTSGDRESLAAAIDVFRRIERHARDESGGGYLEALSREWAPCAEMRLGEGDPSEKKSMNCHLHVLEAYTGLFRSWRDPDLAGRLRELVEIFLRRILDRGGVHFGHFFDEAWRPRSEGYTFGHDIEGSWLLCEAAEVLGDPGLIGDVRALAARMARAVLAEGLDADGGLLYAGRDGRITDDGKEWWPQAEAVVGFLNAWQITGDEAFLDAAGRCWRFIRERIVDPRGEWYWRVSRDGTPDESKPKVSAWKCPYHNARCCLEVLTRLGGEIHRGGTARPEGRKQTDGRDFTAEGRGGRRTE
jgi:mannobiose 2-epimerase